MKKEMQKSTFLILAAVVCLLHVLLVIGYGTQKEGFHEDEYFTYWSSSGRPGDITVCRNGAWYSGYELLSRFFVSPTNRFDIMRVVQNQAQDVHPPLYYLTLNVLMSLGAGKFYKWFGILLNLLYSLVSCAGIMCFVVRLDKSPRRRFLALLSGLSFAAAPSAISNCMLTRMYVMSGMWTVIYANIFLTLVRNYNCSWRRFWKITVCGAVTCFCAFLTHYFALLVPFLLTFAYCVYVLCRRKGIVKMLVYGCSMLAAVGLAVLVYPSCIRHIFLEYRGTGAMSGLKSGNLLELMKYFLPLLNQYVFAGGMWIISGLALLCLTAGGIVFFLKKRGDVKKSLEWVYILIVSMGSCVVGICVLCKVALMAGSPSTRFFFPVTGFFLGLLAYVFGKTVCALAADKAGGWKETILCLCLAICVLVPSVAGYLQGNVLFLYHDEKEKKLFSEKYSEYPVIVIFSPDASYRSRSWYVDDQLWPFDAVFYADYEYIMSDFNDEKIQTAEKLVLFMDAPADVCDHLLEMNDRLSGYQLIRHDPFFYVYLLE